MVDKVRESLKRIDHRLFIALLFMGLVHYTSDIFPRNTSGRMVVFDCWAVVMD